MKLQSMTDFVLGTLSVLDNYNPLGLNEDIVSRYISITNYAKFLKQPLTLGMFIPCDKEGKPLDKPVAPKYFDPTEPVPEEAEQEFYDYDKAKQRVLFDGVNRCEAFTLVTMWRTVEDLTNSLFNITLTPNAIKQIGL